MDTSLLQRRCPRLGSPVAFKYCRTHGDHDGICGLIRNCWWEVFDINAYLQNTLSPEQLKDLDQARPPSKLNCILDIIQTVQQK